MRNITVLLLLICVVIHFTHLPWSLCIHLQPTFQYLRCARDMLHPCVTPLVMRAHYLLSLAGAATTDQGCLVSLVSRSTLVRIADQLVKPLLFVINDWPLLLILSDHGRWCRALEMRGSFLELLFILHQAGHIVLCMHILDMILLRLLVLLTLHIFNIILNTY